MNFSKVVAILNITDYDVINERLKQLDIPGITISMVKGYGDYINEFSPYGFSENMKLEVYTSNEQAKEIALVISQLANETTEGGGVIAIEPVSELFNVRKLSTK